jgi:hypothetical protein
MNDDGRNRFLRACFACSENLIVDFLYIVIEDKSYHTYLFYEDIYQNCV